VPGNVETALFDRHGAKRAAVHIFGNDGNALPVMIGDIFECEQSADEGGRCGWTIRDRQTMDPQKLPYELQPLARSSDVFEGQMDFEICTGHEAGRIHSNTSP
jgi:hypothetical protein